jgi:hypothetical protein
MKKYRKYLLNEKFFNSPAKWGEKQAYVLGWILSDGHINKNSNCISLKLQQKDAPILELIKKLLDCNGRIIIEKRRAIHFKGMKAQDRAVLNVFSRELKNNLNDLGFDNKKGEQMKFPVFLKKNLIPHFLRGYIEGDGCISYSYDKKRLLGEFNVIGTKNFCKNFTEIIQSSCKVVLKKCSDNPFGNGAIRIRLSGNISILKLFIFLYQDAHYFLPRKLKKFLRIINFCRKRPALLKRDPKVIKRAISVFQRLP